MPLAAPAPTHYASVAVQQTHLLPLDDIRCCLSQCMLCWCHAEEQLACMRVNAKDALLLPACAELLSKRNRQAPVNSS